MWLFLIIAFLLLAHVFFLFTNSKGLSFNPWRFVNICRSSLEGFIASFANFLLQIKHDRKGASESPVVIYPYCKYDFIYWRLKKAFLFFVIIESSSGGVVSFAKKLNTDVCNVLFSTKSKI